MHPQTNYGHVVATVEIFTGMCFLAVMTGLVFARFSRPRARFVFASPVVIGRHEGQQALMVRAANARRDTISRASARLWLVRLERTREGDELRRFYELTLDRSEHPMFVLSWMLSHVIDEASPLHGATAADLADTDTLLVLNVGGVDDSSRPTALCSARLFLARYSLAPPLQGHHKRFAAGTFLTRLHEFDDVSGRGGRLQLLPLVPRRQEGVCAFVCELHEQSSLGHRLRGEQGQWARRTDEAASNDLARVPSSTASALARLVGKHASAQLVLTTTTM